MDCQRRSVFAIDPAYEVTEQTKHAKNGVKITKYSLALLVAMIATKLQTHKKASCRGIVACPPIHSLHFMHSANRILIQGAMLGCQCCYTM